MADDIADDAAPVASWPSRGRGRRSSRTPRREILPPLAAIGFLTLAHFMFGAAQPMSALFVSLCLVFSALASLMLAGPRYVTFGMALGAAAVWLFGLAGWAGSFDKAAPHLAVLFGAGALWTAAYVCARQRRALDIAWAGLVWTSFIYCAWMFFRHIAAGFGGAGDPGTFEGAFASPAETAVMFGMLALMGSARVCHVLKQIDAEASSRSEGVEKLLRDGLGGLLLLGFAITCLGLCGSRVGLMVTGGVLVLHAWWDTRTLVRRSDRGLLRKIIGRVTPFLAIGLVVWGVWLAYVEDETVRGLVGAAQSPRLQRIQTYFDAFLQRPVFGHGLGSIEAVRDRAMTLGNARALMAPGDAQNVALTWLVETGVAGTAALLLALGAMHAALFRALGNNHAPRTFLRLALAASLLLAVHGGTDSSLALPSLVWLYAFLMGAGCGVAAWKRRSSSGAGDSSAG
jgi:O-antigen ligase